MANETNAVEASRISNRVILWFLSIASLFGVLFYIQLKYLPHEAGALVKYFLYMGLSNALIPLPTNPALLLAGKFFNPFLIALTGALATCIANMNEYLILNPVFAYERIARVKQSHTYKYFRRLFERSPFLTLVLANTLPIPVDPVRWMSISLNYSKRSYLLATFFGRFPRYLAIAWVGYRFQFSFITVVGIGAGIAALCYLVKRLKRRDEGTHPILVQHLEMEKCFKTIENS